MPAEPEPIAADLDRLYWDSDLSVADIATRLELSRRALYDSIRPRPAGTRCESCGHEMSFANRSARDAARAACTMCVHGTDVEADGEEDDDLRDFGDGAAGLAFESATRDAFGEHDTPDADRALGVRAVRLGAAALLGAALGAAVGIALTRRG